MQKIARIIFLFFLLPQIFLVSIYPIFSVRSYFGELRTYRGLDGTTWLQQEYADDWKAIEWLKSQQGRPTSSHMVGLRGTTTIGTPIVVEADGDSYTDFNHISAFSGVPTVVGWAVHEWLWRGSYDIVGPRREEVRRIYESPDLADTKRILEKYGITHIVVGTLERQKFQALNEQKLLQLGPVVFESGQTALYAVGY